MDSKDEKKHSAPTTKLTNKRKDAPTSDGTHKCELCRNVIPRSEGVFDVPGWYGGWQCDSCSSERSVWYHRGEWILHRKSLADEKAGLCCSEDSEYCSKCDKQPRGEPEHSDSDSDSDGSDSEGDVKFESNECTYCSGHVDVLTRMSVYGYVKDGPLVFCSRKHFLTWACLSKALRDEFVVSE